MRGRRLLSWSSVLALVLLMACNSGSSTSEDDTQAPEAGAGATFSAVTDVAATVSWGEAVDDVTAAEDLTYRLAFSADEAEIDTLAELEALSGDAVALDWTAAALSTDLSALTADTTYYVAIAVRDEAGNTAFYGAESFATESSLPSGAGNITFSAITSTSVTVAWSATRDAQTAASEIEYKLVTAADSDSIDTLEEIDAIVDEVNVRLDWTADTRTLDLEDLTPETVYYVAVVARDADDNGLLYEPDLFTTPAADAPSVGTAISTDADYLQMSLAWGEAADDVTATEELEYKIVSASHYGSIDTIAEADAIADSEDGLILDWSPNTTEVTTNLDPDTNYFFNVLVRDGDGNLAIYDVAEDATLTPKSLFLASTPNGNLEGVSGADALCAAAENKPSAATFKAMISDGTTRIACTSSDCAGAGGFEHEDWVFANDTSYKRADTGAFVGYTDGVGLLQFPLSASLTDDGTEIWTGLTRNWTSTADTCDDWTYSDGDSAFLGDVGNAASVNNSELDFDSLLNIYLQFCDRTNVYLVCVEQ